MKKMLKNTKRATRNAAESAKTPVKREKMPRKRGSIAVLVDAENVPAKRFPQVLESAKKRGRVSEVRIYGPLSLMNSEPWSIVAAAYGAKRVPCAGGTALDRGSADMRLAMDAMDLMSSKKVQAFTLVGGGAELAPLARRLRAAGKHVVGVAC